MNIICTFNRRWVCFEYYKLCRCGGLFLHYIYILYIALYVYKIILTLSIARKRA